MTQTDRPSFSLCARVDAHVETLDDSESSHVLQGGVIGVRQSVVP